nr:MAG TPA: DNA helicase [Caudoviricetes sp.]
MILYKQGELLYLVPENTSEPTLLNKITKHFNKIPPYQLLPMYPGIPRPEVFIWVHSKQKTKQNLPIYITHFGLYGLVEEYCIKSGIKYNWHNGVAPNTILKNDFKEPNFNDLSLEVREYQKQAILKILDRKMSLSELATRAGKTLIMTVVLKAINKKSLVIVPSIQLVKQGIKDINEYTHGRIKVGGICGNLDIDGSEQIVIGTFQSLIKRPKQFFEQFEMLCVDEAHKIPCKSIKDLIDRCSNVDFRFGFTGSLPKENTIERQVCESLMGPCIQKVSAMELIEEQFLAQPIIQPVHLKYDVQSSFFKESVIQYGEALLKDKVSGELPISVAILKNKVKQEDYVYVVINALKSISKLHVLENQLIQIYDKRLGEIGNLIDRQDNLFKGHVQNYILFAHNTEYISALSYYLKERYGEAKNIEKITGSTSSKKRTQILENLNNKDNKVSNILVGSFGCIGTGLTFKNIQCGIFTQSFKSEIINKQSLGRLMLKGNSGNDKLDNYFYLYDIVDDFKGLGKLKSHGSTKKSLYKQEGYSIEPEIIKTI